MFKATKQRAAVVMRLFFVFRLKLIVLKISRRGSAELS